RPRLPGRWLSGRKHPPAKRVGGVKLPRGFESLPSRHCPVSGHTGHLLQDIVHRPAPAEWLVVAKWVKGQSADEFAVVADDADVRTGDEQANPAVPGCGPHRDVTEPAQVANGDLAGGSDLGPADAEAGRPKRVEAE